MRLFCVLCHIYAEFTCILLDLGGGCVCSGVVMFGAKDPSAKANPVASVDGAPSFLFDTLALIAKPGTFFIRSAGVIICLMSLSLLAIAISGPEEIGNSVRFNQPSSVLVQLFFMDRETSLPTFFNYALLVTACGLLVFAARIAFLSGSSWRYHWLALGITFLGMSFDEAAQIHERLTGPMQQLFDASGAFLFAWIIPGLAFVCLFAFTFLNFLRALPRRIAAMMFLGGALYVSGAIGMELIGGSVVSSGAWTSWSYALTVTLEEGLEMFGVAVFCCAILLLLSTEAKSDRGYFS